MTAKEIEIMAPVGSYESLMAAIQGGANSVYFGIGKLNMRSRSSQNFTLDDLAKISSICHQNGLKSYITLNTIVYDKELAEIKQIINSAKENNISAILPPIRQLYYMHTHRVLRFTCPHKPILLT